MPSLKWKQRMLALANHIATWSKDQSTKVGCVIADNDSRVLSTGYNGFPVGVDDDVPERHERPLKYRYTAHAEANAIYTAAHHGVALCCATMYLPWYPCCDCAKAIVQSGIGYLVCYKPDLTDARWGEDFVISQVILSEGGVEVEYLDPVPLQVV